ncbi:MAG TPA: DHH family phosphoesterase [Solirubrobacteraceae bacterium]|jgi:phosphoesterase RecJ-like protein|nr:DHH family phosphoesterase [Solirubrobacteraceae bacterium]
MSEHNGNATSRLQVLERIRSDSSFVLATHENMDGDALGSLVAMHGLLTALGKDAPMFIAPSEFPLPHEYRFFALEDDAVDRGPTSPGGRIPMQFESGDVIQSAPADIAQRTVIFLDCGNIDRNSAQVLRDGAHLLNIDHHHDNTHFGTLDHVVPSASCTAEIVWELMNDLEFHPPPAIAEALYIGLITDTGRFMYENTGPRAHEMAAVLIAAGVDVQKVYRRLFEEMPPAKLALFARALGRVSRHDEGELTLAWLDAGDFIDAGAEASYSEGIVDILRAVQGTKVAALVRELIAPERRGERKVSLRATDDDVDVSSIARAQGGGGHRRAAGFSTTLEVEQLIAFLRQEIAAQLHPAPAHA